MQVSVLLAGVLTGMGRTAPCEILVKRRPFEGGGFVYSEVVVLNGPPDFPNGDYTLTFNDVRFPVKHIGVLWVLAGDQEPRGLGHANLEVTVSTEEVKVRRGALKRRKSRESAAK